MAGVVVTTEGEGNSDAVGVTVGSGGAVRLGDGVSEADTVGVGEPMGSAAANGVATMPSASPIKAALTALEIRPNGERR
jgi:hypothetical protein